MSGRRAAGMQPSLEGLVGAGNDVSDRKSRQQDVAFMTGSVIGIREDAVGRKPMSR